MDIKNIIKKLIGKPINWKDNDKDGIFNLEDCQKNNPKKQGNIHDIGVQQIQRLQGNIPNSYRKYDRI